MKKPNIVINLYHAVITGLMFVAFTACEEAANEKLVQIHDGAAPQQTLTYKLMKPAEKALTVSLIPILDEETVEAWNDAQNLKDVTGQGGIIWTRR